MTALEWQEVDVARQVTVTARSEAEVALGAAGAAGRPRRTLQTAAPGGAGWLVSCVMRMRM